MYDHKQTVWHRSTRWRSARTNAHWFFFIAHSWRDHLPALRKTKARLFQLEMITQWIFKEIVRNDHSVDFQKNRKLSKTIIICTETKTSQKVFDANKYITRSVQLLENSLKKKIHFEQRRTKNEIRAFIKLKCKQIAPTYAHYYVAVY